MTRVSSHTRHNMVILHQEGLSEEEIARQTGVSGCAIQALRKTQKNSVEDKKHSGQPKKLSSAEQHINLMSPCARKTSSSALSSEPAETTGTPVHQSTVRKTQVRGGLRRRLTRSKKGKKKTLLRCAKKAKQLICAWNHKHSNRCSELKKAACWLKGWRVV